MAEDNPIRTWLIELDGRDFDLAQWVQLFQDRSVALVKQAPGRDEKSAHFVHSERLDDVKDAEVHQKAAALLAMMNGAAKIWLKGARPVSQRWLWYERTDGTREPMKFVYASAHLHAETLASVSTSGPPNLPMPSHAQETVRSALSNADVADALEHFTQPDNWFDFWKAYEIVEAAVGGEAALKSRRWVEVSEVNDFNANCNFHRHSRVSKKRPKKLRALSREGARDILRRILQGWLS